MHRSDEGSKPNRKKVPRKPTRSPRIDDAKELRISLPTIANAPVSERAVLRGPFEAPNPTLSSLRPNDCFWPLPDTPKVEQQVCFQVKT
jgi:hypothetical protein